MKELASSALWGKNDYGDFWYTYDSKILKGEYYRCKDKVRFSMKIDGQEIPFATVERSKNAIFPNSYQAQIEILPCMIPQALDAISTYMQTHPVISENSFSKQDAKTYIKEIQSVQRGLINLLESTLLERKAEESYNQRRVANS